MTFDRDKWDARYREATGPGEPARALVDFLHLLPGSGRALDLACGLGANAFCLAERGLEAHAWDASPVAIERVVREAEERGILVRAIVRDVVVAPPPPASFDVIVVAHFLERALAPALVRALRPGGLLYYQTWIRTRVDEIGPRDDAYRLADGELLRMLAASAVENTSLDAETGAASPRAGLQILVYREEGRVGDLSRGFRNQAMLVGRRV